MADLNASHIRAKSRRMTSTHSGRGFAKRLREEIWRVSGYCFSPTSIRLAF